MDTKELNCEELSRELRRVYQELMNLMSSVIICRNIVNDIIENKKNGEIINKNVARMDINL